MWITSAVKQSMQQNMPIYRLCLVLLSVFGLGLLAAASYLLYRHDPTVGIRRGNCPFPKMSNYYSKFDKIYEWKTTYTRLSKTSNMSL